MLLSTPSEENVNAIDLYRTVVKLLEDNSDELLRKEAKEIYSLNVDGKTRSEIIEECASVEVKNYFK